MNESLCDSSSCLVFFRLSAQAYFSGRALRRSRRMSRSAAPLPGSLRHRRTRPVPKNCRRNRGHLHLTIKIKERALGSFRVTLDAQGRILTRDPLRPIGGQFRLPILSVPAPTAVATPRARPKTKPSASVPSLATRDRAKCVSKMWHGLTTLWNHITCVKYQKMILYVCEVGVQPSRCEGICQRACCERAL